MKIKHPMLKSSQLMIVIAITVASVSFVIELGNVGNVMAQSDFFAQPVTVNVGKTNQDIGDYGLIIRNIDNGNYVDNLYSDSSDSPRNVAIDGTIGIHDGDRLIACVVEMDTKEMTCDEQTAHYSQSVTEFFVDMNKASPVPQQNNDGNQQGGSGSGIDQFNPNPNPSTNATNTNSNNNSTFSGGSNFTPTTRLE